MRHRWGEWTRMPPFASTPARTAGAASPRVVSPYMCRRSISAPGRPQSCAGRDRDTSTPGASGFHHPPGHRTIAHRLALRPVAAMARTASAAAEGVPVPIMVAWPTGFTDRGTDSGTATRDGLCAGGTPRHGLNDEATEGCRVSTSDAEVGRVRHVLKIRVSAVRFCPWPLAPQRLITRAARRLCQRHVNCSRNGLPLRCQPELE